MNDLDFIIVTYQRPKFIKFTLESFILKKKEFNSHLFILDGGSDDYKENIGGENLNTSQVVKRFIKEFKCSGIITYKQYNNNGNWYKILENYVYDLSNSHYFAIIGDDDIFLDFEGFKKAIYLQNNNFKNQEIGIINLFYQDNTRVNSIPIIDEIIDGCDYINKFIDLNYLDNQSVMHLYNLKVIKKNNSLHFLKLRKRGLEDFFGWDIYFIFNIAAQSKVLYVDTIQAIEMGHHGNEVRYTVKYPLTQWLCYFLYSKFTVIKLVNEKKITNARKRKFLNHWINSFFICYSKFLFSEYETKYLDYNKVNKYLGGHILTYVIKEIFFNGILINWKIIQRVAWILLLKFRIFKNKMIIFKLYLIVKSIIKRIIK